MIEKLAVVRPQVQVVLDRLKDVPWTSSRDSSPRKLAGRGQRRRRGSYAARHATIWLASGNPHRAQRPFARLRPQVRAVAAAGQAPRSVWDGVYTEAQAVRGEKVSAEHCARCHGQTG